MPAPPQQPPARPARGGRTAAIVLGAAVAFAVVAGATGTAAYLVTSDHGEEAPGTAAAGPVSPSVSAVPTAVALTAAELYDRSAWPYDVTFDNGNRIQGELQLIETYEHPDCPSAGLTEVAKLALASCAHRVEAAYRGTVEGTMVGEQVLVFSDTNAAAAFLRRFEEAYAADVVAFQDPAEIQATAPWTISWVDGVDRYVVLTVVFGAESRQQSGDDVAARNRETVQYLTTHGP